MGSRGYQDLNYRIAGNSPYSWGGGSYTNFMFDAGDSYPSGVITAAFTSYQLPDSPAGTNDIVHTHSFEAIAPRVYDSMSIIDGTISGNIKFGVSHQGVNTEYTRITNIDLMINAIDENGSSRTVSTNTIWSGALTSTDAASTISTRQTRFWVDVEDIFVYSNERLVFEYEYTATVHSIQAGSYGTLYLYATDETEESSLTLPFILS